MPDWETDLNLRRPLQKRIEAIYSETLWLDLVLPRPTPFEPFPSVVVGSIDLLKWLNRVGDLTFYLGTPRDLFDEVDRNPMMPWDRGVPRQDDGVRRLVEAYRSQRREYEGAVFRQLRLIADKKNSESGPALMREIQAAKRTVEIQPYILSGHTDWNAYAGIVGGRALELQHTKGCAFAKAYGKDWVGTGGGADDIIHYTPQMWEPEGQPRIQGPGTRADELLFHELVHSTRNMRGLTCQKPMNGDYDDTEEYIAVAVTNIYLSEKGRALRGSHKWGSELAKPDAQRWYRDNPQKLNVHPQALVERFKEQQSSFYSALAKIPASKAWFNPVREHFEEGEAIRSHFMRLEQSSRIR